MEDPKKIWRVNRKPRFTVLDMGEYMAADDGPRETLLRNMKFERIARTLTYRRLYQAVASYLASPTRDRRILERCRQSIKDELTKATNPTTIDNLAYELRALETFERSLNAMDIGSVTLEHVGHATPLTMEGVKISVRPTVHIRAHRPRGADLLGALVVDLAKGAVPKTDDAQARLTAAMTNSAVLVNQYVEAVFEGADGKPSRDHSVVFHTHRQQWVFAPTNYRSMLRNIEAVCRNIARSWAGIVPPPNFDAKLAMYRD